MRHSNTFILIIFLGILSVISHCNQVGPRDEFALTLLNGLNPNQSTSPTVLVGRSAGFQISALSLSVRYTSSTNFSVRLTQAPTDDVTVNLTFDNTKLQINGSGVSPHVLTFTPANYNTLQTVPITAIVNSANSETIVLTTTSNDPNFDAESTNISASITQASISYAGSPFTFYNNVGIGSVTASVSGTPSGCSPSPALPSGLSIVGTTCAISGTPLATSGNTSYTITMYAGPPAVTTTIDIQVLNPLITYTGSSFVFKQNETIPTLTPTINFTPTSCSVSPALPSGLSLNTTTCVITGTPTGTQVGTTYTVTASRGSITDSENITIQIEASVYKIFITASTYNGNLGGISGADAKCQADSNKPATGTFKAMLVDGVSRTACTTDNCSGGVGENVDWVFQSGRIYIRASDSASLLSPNPAGILPVTTNNFSTNPFTLNHSFDSGSLKEYWTGFAISNYWQEATQFTENTCNDWTTGAVTATASNGGRVGASNSTTYSSIRSGSGRSCDTSNYLLCVEQ